MVCGLIVYLQNVWAVTDYSQLGDNSVTQYLVIPQQITII